MNVSQCEKDIKIIAVLVTFTKDVIKEKTFFMYKCLKSFFRSFVVQEITD